MQEEKYSIKHWAKDERPREKLRLKGAESLADSELIAILLQNGTTGKSAIDLSRELLALAKNNLQGFGRLSYRDMMKV
jgi:DNA repair protein RadC